MGWNCGYFNNQLTCKKLYGSTIENGNLVIHNIFGKSEKFHK
jgi:hypothetical protein